MKAKEWNEKYKVGQEVVLTDDMGVKHHTSTTSEAWEMCGSSVVGVEYTCGGYDLDRIRPMNSAVMPNHRSA